MRCWTVRHADDFGATYLVIPFERATRPGRTVHEGRFECPECRTVSATLESLPHLPREIVEDLHLNFTCSVCLMEYSDLLSNDDDTDPLCVFSVCGHARCCVRCATQWAASNSRVADADAHEVFDFFEAPKGRKSATKKTAFAGGSTVTFDENRVCVTVPVQADLDKDEVECDVFGFDTEVSLHGANFRVRDVLRMPDVLPPDSTATAAPPSLMNVFRAISSVVVCVRRTRSGTDTTRPFNPPVKVVIPHNALPLETREVVAMCGASVNAKVAGQVLYDGVNIDLKSGVATVLLSKPCAWLTLCIVRERHVPPPQKPLTLHGPHGIVVELPAEGAELQRDFALEMVGDVRNALSHAVSPVVELFPHVDFGGKFVAAVTLPHCLDLSANTLDPSSIVVCCRHSDGRIEALDTASIANVSATTITFVTSHFGEWVIRLASAIVGGVAGAGLAMVSPTPPSTSYVAGAALMGAAAAAALVPCNLQIIPAVDWVNLTLRVVIRRIDYGTPTCENLKSKPWYFDAQDRWTFDGVSFPLTTELSISVVVHGAEEKLECAPWTTYLWQQESISNDFDIALSLDPSGHKQQPLKLWVKLEAKSPVFTQQRVITAPGSQPPAERPPVEIAVFFSTQPTASHGIWESLVKEINDLDDHCKSGKVHYAIPHQVAHNFTTVDDLDQKLTLLSGRRGAGTRADLVLQFIGHGEDGHLVFDSTLNVPKMVRLIASCRPTCVIFNACETLGIAHAVHIECTKRELSTVVGFWHTPVVNRACERLSKSLFPYVSGWTSAAQHDTSPATAFLNGIALARDVILEDEVMNVMFKCRLVMPRLDTLPKSLPPPDACACDACTASAGVTRLGASASDRALQAHGLLSRAQEHATRADISDGTGNGVNDCGAVERGTSYQGSLKSFGDGDDWLHKCWQKIFRSPTLETVKGEGQYRCFFSHSFDSIPGPSRAYYFESWPVGAAESIIVLLHVHYWDEMPDQDSGGLVKSINVRRGWRIDRSELTRRVEGDCHDPVPPPQDMIADVSMWVNAMNQLLHDPLKDVEVEKRRTRAALETFAHTYFCPEHDLWLEKHGACVNGGPTAKTVKDKRSVDKPGWEFTAGDPYPLRAPRDYPGGFESPKVPFDLVAAVLVHAEQVRRMHPPQPAKDGGVYDGNAAWRGPGKLGACREQARRLAEASGDFGDSDFM
jgi:hypothetical protein